MIGFLRKIVHPVVAFIISGFVVLMNLIYSFFVLSKTNGNASSLILSLILITLLVLLSLFIAKENKVAILGTLICYTAYISISNFVSSVNGLFEVTKANAEGLTVVNSIIYLIISLCIFISSSLFYAGKFIAKERAFKEIITSVSIICLFIAFVFAIFYVILRAADNAYSDSKSYIIFNDLALIGIPLLIFVSGALSESVTKNENN